MKSGNPKSKVQSLKYIIAIDGPAGSGKSTIAKLLAKQLGFLYIDSGAMYRAVALYMMQNKLLNLSAKNLLKHIKKINIQFEASDQRVLLNSKDVTLKIRTSSVNRLVSQVSALKVVREEMVRRQKQYGKYDSIVMDGRDIGTNVFKHADLKIYLTASVKERAKRRKNDTKSGQQACALSELACQMQARDHYDSTRNISPLSKAQDAIVIDSSSLTITEVLNKVNLFIPS